MKKITSKIYIFSLIILLGLSSCEVLVTKNNLMLNKGISLETFKKQDFHIDNNFFLSKLSTKNKSKYEIFATKIEGAVSKEIYYYAFENDKLIYWGYPYQFTRNDNITIREIGEEAFDYTVKEYGLQQMPQ